MKYSPKSTVEQGFTLVEVLISLFIFSLISVGAIGALFSTLEASERLEVAAEDVNALARARAILRADFDAVVLRQNRDALGGLDPLVISTDGDALITFTRGGVQNPGGLLLRGDLQRVSYIFRDGALIRRTLPHENPAQGSEWRERVILDKLENVELFAQSISNDQIFRLPNWRLTAAEARGPSAVRSLAFDITTNDGVMTTHLFELVL